VDGDRVRERGAILGVAAAAGTNRADPPSDRPIDRIVGVSPWSDNVRRTIGVVAVHHSSVLVMGPSGTGKELIARAVHGASPRARRPFIPVDCAVTTGTLFASHMFGHVKGAFTGAMTATLGCFRAADGGTIFLDEIGEMELELQAKLLRVLQQRVVVPVGSHQEIPVDVRVLAATNRDLAAEVAAGRFREDLFYRLNVVAIRTVPLKDRPEDIPVLAAGYLAELAARYGMPLCSLAPEAIRVLQGYSWPGNVRELQNVLERAVMFAAGEEIEPRALKDVMSFERRADLVADLAADIAPPEADDGRAPTLPPDASLARAARQGIVTSTPVAGVFRVEPKAKRPVDGPAPSAGVAAAAAATAAAAEEKATSAVAPPANALRPEVADPAPHEARASTVPPVDAGAWLTLADMERMHLERTLAATMNNKSQAAKLLGIDRSVLRRKLQRYGLGDPGDAAGGGGDAADAGEGDG